MSGESFFRIDAFSNSSDQLLVADVEPWIFYPILNTFGFTKRGYNDVVSFVATLFSPRRPATVLGAVILIVVDPVNGQAGVVTVGDRPKAKCLEIIAPFVAHDDASRAVVLVGTVRRVVAAHVDEGPDASQAKRLVTVNRRRGDIGTVHGTPPCRIYGKRKEEQVSSVPISLSE